MRMEKNSAFQEFGISVGCLLFRYPLKPLDPVIKTESSGRIIKGFRHVVKGCE
jgi:hypothetical protein